MSQSLFFWNFKLDAKIFLSLKTHFHKGTTLWTWSLHFSESHVSYIQFVKSFLVITCLLTQYMSSCSTSLYRRLSQVQVMSSLWLVIENKISGKNPCKKWASYKSVINILDKHFEPSLKHNIKPAQTQPL